jgi:hypothetical protein
LEKWEKASQECKILDARVKWYYYDSYGGEPRIEFGRLYVESPNVARLDSGKAPILESNDWAAIDHSVVWNEAESLRIDPKEHQYVKAPIATIDETWNRSCDGFFANLGRAFCLASLPPPRLQRLYPLLVDVRADEVRKQFDLSLERQGDDILVDALPKKGSQPAALHSRIRVLLDSKSFQTKGVQCIDDSQHYFSVVLYDAKINEKPSDRDQLLKPDLSAFRELDVAMVLEAEHSK